MSWEYSSLIAFYFCFTLLIMLLNQKYANKYLVINLPAALFFWPLVMTDSFLEEDYALKKRIGPLVIWFLSVALITYKINPSWLSRYWGLGKTSSIFFDFFGLIIATILLIIINLLFLTFCQIRNPFLPKKKKNKATIVG